MQKFQDPQTIYRPTDIINDNRREYRVVMSYQKAWKAKECALKNLMGSTEESYVKLAKYCHNMGRTNSNSAFFIETDGQNHFKYLFMALQQCIRGFQNTMRPLILVDGRALKARYEGKLTVATYQDVNIQIYPLTFGIIDGEIDLAMRWFFTKLREVIGDIENLAYVTDQGYYLYHIQGNLKTKYRDSGIVALFRKAVEAYSFEEFVKFMSEIEHKLQSAWEYLLDMGVEHWARSHFTRH
ncbi:uncharacterized protein LOC111382097 [Olea europaea var. sylvestris]|uniref:uncharacterized protein LOC111382097 n=1 Tax=Olea europaea var. sylvestris TaxID=158386 RepID=UPI000C1D61EF|nr:uncharacterized protein LOC111382097 [Olea europaea var. sylvestris]